MPEKTSSSDRGRPDDEQPIHDRQRRPDAQGREEPHLPLAHAEERPWLSAVAAKKSARSSGRFRDYPAHWAPGGELGKQPILRPQIEPRPPMAIARKTNSSRAPFLHGRRLRC
jgi:hypothetical protein